MLQKFIKSVAVPVVCLVLAGCSGTCSMEDLREASGAEESEELCGVYRVNFCPVTRSSISYSDNIQSVVVGCYADSVLACRSEGGGGNDIMLTLVKGRTYHIYVVANAALYDMPLHERLVSGSVVCWPGIRELSENGIPMSGRTCFTAGEDSVLDVPIERLVARYDFLVDSSELDGEFTPKRVCLKNSAAEVTPFAPSVAGRVLDGDYEEFTADFQWPVQFYMFENLQGRLLPSNTDPWSKVPESIPEQADLCTYLELTGDYFSGGILHSDVCWRFYLGEDAVTDFNIRRNTVNSVILRLSDDGLSSNSWKIVPGEITDFRSIGFLPSSLVFTESGQASVRIVGSYLSDYLVYEDGNSMAEAGLSYFLDRGTGTVTITSQGPGDASCSASLYAMTPDGAHKCVLDISVPVSPVGLSAYAPGYEKNGIWKYELGAPSAPCYRVEATLSNGQVKDVTAECTVSIIGTSGCISFDSGKACMLCDMDHGGDGTVTFSYALEGDTVTVSKKWYKLYVTSAFLTGFPLNSEGTPSLIYYSANESIGTQYHHLALSSLSAGAVYNDGTVRQIPSSEYAVSGVNIFPEDKYLVCRTEKKPAASVYYPALTVLRKGTVEVTACNRYKGVQVSAQVHCYSRSRLSDNPVSYHEPEHKLESGVKTIDIGYGSENVRYYVFEEDADGIRPCTGTVGVYYTPSTGSLVRLESGVTTADIYRSVPASLIERTHYIHTLAQDGYVEYDGIFPRWGCERYYFECDR